VANDPRIVPVGIPVDSLAVAAYMSYAVTKLKNDGDLEEEGRPEDQVPPFKDLPPAEQAGWLAAVQGVLSNGGMTFATRPPGQLAIDLGVMTVEEIAETYPIRQAEDGNVRLPSTPDATTWQMFGRITARFLGHAGLIVPAAMTQGILKETIGPTGDETEGAPIIGAVAVVEIPYECFRALTDAGFEDGETVSLGILNPMSAKDKPNDAMLEPTEGGAH